MTKKGKIQFSNDAKILYEPISNDEIPEEYHSLLENEGYDEEAEIERGYTQWSVGENGKYIPCFATKKKVPPGIYEMRQSQSLGFYIEKQSQINDELIELPMTETKEIMDDMKKFWTRGDVYKKYKYTHKRGILLYGGPGNGKSYLIQVLMRYIIKDMKGIVINLKDYESVELFLNYAGPIIRVIEKDTPIIVIMEDIDNILDYSNSVLTKVLNMLDGLKQINNVVYMATTNYIEKLQGRISNRPSRFDRKYKIGPPSAEVREAYIRHKIKQETNISEEDVKKWIRETEGLSISHLKELLLSIIILDEPFEKTIDVLKKMGERQSSFSDENKKIGFRNS